MPLVFKRTASVPSCIIVRLSRRVIFARHGYTGEDTCSAGFPAGGVEKLPPESGQAIVQSNNYWSGTEYAPNTNNAWNFNTNNGNQNANNKNNNMFAMAVRPGE